MNKAYSKFVVYSFEACGETILITEFDSWGVSLEEARKNGQEDTHMKGELERIDGTFQWLDGKELFVEYHSQELADEIRKYLNKHGLPE